MNASENRETKQHQYEHNNKSLHDMTVSADQHNRMQQQRQRTMVNVDYQTVWGQRSSHRWLQVAVDGGMVVRTDETTAARFVSTRLARVD